jgi:hypothetical protein
VDLAGEHNINVLQEGKIKRRSNAIYLIEDDCATIVAILEGVVDSASVVACCITPWFDKATPFRVSRRRVW